MGFHKMSQASLEWRFNKRVRVAGEVPPFGASRVHAQVTFPVVGLPLLLTRWSNDPSRVNRP